MEFAPGGGTGGIGRLSFQHDPVRSARERGRGGHECPGVGVERPAVQLIGIRNLHDFAEVHHGDAMAHVLHNS